MNRRRHQHFHNYYVLIIVVVVQQLLGLTCVTWAAMPDAELRIQQQQPSSSTTSATPTTVDVVGSPWLVTYGLFGAAKETSITGTIALPPFGDELLCNEANGLVDYRTNQTTVHNNSNTTTSTTTTNERISSTTNFTVPLYSPLSQKIILLVPRGNCSFENKAWSAERLGAAGILIYNTLSSRYGWNETTQQVIYPKPRDDYECANGKDDTIDATKLQLDPPRYNATFHNPLLTVTSPNSLCQFHSNLSSTCASQRCLVTGPATDNGTGVFTACCAWDISLTMSTNTSLEKTNGIPQHIVSAFLTMAQGDALLALLLASSQSSSSQSSLVVSLSPRYVPKWNASFFFLWLLGTFVVALASWNSAHEYRYTMLKLRQLRQRRQRQAEQEGLQPPPEQPSGQDDPPQQQQQPEQQQLDMGSEGDLQPASGQDCDLISADGPSPRLAPSSNGVEQAPPLPTTLRNVNESPTNTTTTTITEEPPALNDGPTEPPTTTTTTNPSWSSSLTNMFRNSSTAPSSTSSSSAIVESLDMKLWHVGVFLVVASTLLFMLFFFKFYRIVVVLYAFGCARAVSLILLRPLLEGMERFLCFARRQYDTNNSSDNTNSNNNNKPTLFLHKQIVGDWLGVTWLDVLSGVGGYVWSALWLYVYFTRTDPSRLVFYWVSQDLFGMALCILILSLIKLNSMRIGTVLLIAVFFYDIFFVFLTPYLFGGKSIMVSVATSGGAPEGSADFCDKYPRDRSCRGGNPLPFLFTIPHINDYRGGSSLLGLGDVVLPGIVLSFAARLDEARRLLSRHTSLQLPQATAPEKWYQGYFPPLVFAYMVGLLMANCAVVWMQRGQPALLYLVPACLGTILIVGRKELKDLWKGPKHLRWADRLTQYVLRRV